MAEGVVLAVQAREALLRRWHSAQPKSKDGEYHSNRWEDGARQSEQHAQKFWGRKSKKQMGSHRMNKEISDRERGQGGGEGSASLPFLCIVLQDTFLDYTPYTLGYTPETNSSSSKPGVSLPIVRYSIFQKNATDRVLNNNKSTPLQSPFTLTLHLE